MNDLGNLAYGLVGFLAGIGTHILWLQVKERLTAK